MEANVKKVPVFSTMFFAAIILLVGFMLNVMIIPSGIEMSDDIFWLCSIPTLLIMSGVVIFTVFGEKNKLAEMCGAGSILISFIMMILGSSYAVIIFAGGTMAWLMVFFKYNPLCQKQMQKWLKGIIAEEKIEKA
jgi:uncharacterized membrane protein